MITQKSEHEIQQIAQAPAPVKEHLWIVVLCSILGVALPLVAGSMLWWPWGVPDFMDASWILPTVGLAAVVSVAVGAFLLCFAFRLWWVAVFAGVAWFVGEVLGAVIRTIVEGSSSQLLAWEPFWSSQLGFIFFMAVVPLLLGMLIGGVVGFALGKGRASRQ